MNQQKPIKLGSKGNYFILGNHHFSMHIIRYLVNLSHCVLLIQRDLELSHRSSKFNDAISLK